MNEYGLPGAVSAGFMSMSELVLKGLQQAGRALVPMVLEHPLLSPALLVATLAIILSVRRT